MPRMTALPPHTEATAAEMAAMISPGMEPSAAGAAGAAGTTGDLTPKGARAYLHLAGELIKREEKAAKAAQEAAAAAKEA